MAKNYKEVRICRMCKKRFEPIADGNYKSKSYCPACVQKYIKGKDDKDG
jgi:uncharacterized CHY-type Zn-finger protein